MVAHTPRTSQEMIREREEGEVKMARDSERGEEKLKDKSRDTKGEKCSQKSSGGKQQLPNLKPVITTFSENALIIIILYLYQTV
jgi:hypothetical protein